MTLGATSRGFPRVPRRCRRTHGVGTVAGTVARAERFKRKTQWGHPAVGWKLKGFTVRDLIWGGAIFCAITARDVERKYEQKQPKTYKLFLESYYFSVSTI